MVSRESRLAITCNVDVPVFVDDHDSRVEYRIEILGALGELWTAFMECFIDPSKKVAKLPSTDVGTTAIRVENMSWLDLHVQINDESWDLGVS